MYVGFVPWGLYGSFSWVWVLMGEGLHRSCVPELTFRVIKGTATATQRAELGTGMFQQKVLFAEHAGRQPQALLHAQLLELLSVCLFVFPWLSVITIESFRAGVIGDGKT